jgi:hypothetical protein
MPNKKGNEIKLLFRDGKYMFRSRAGNAFAKCQYLSIQKWPLQGCRAFLSKVMDDFSFRIIF